MSGVLAFAGQQLRGAWRRNLVAAATILVAVSSFVVLTGTVATQRLQVTHEVASNFRSTYDILVRPRGSAADLEKAAGLVRPNFLTGRYGGITLAQVQQIAATPDVEVAAPVAVLGQTTRNVLMTVDVGEVLGTRDHAMVRFSLAGTARNGTAHTSNQSGYLYLTRAPLTSVEQPGTADLAASPALVEQHGGRPTYACLASNSGMPPRRPSVALLQQCWSAASPDATERPPRVEVLFSIPLTVQAIDPTAEVRLSGLGGAMVQGRNLNSEDSYGTDRSGPAPIEAASAVMASSLPLDFQASLKVEQLPDSAITQVLATNDPQRRRDLVLGARPVRTIGTVTRDAAETYSKDVVPMVDGSTAAVDQSMMVLALTQPSDVAYTSMDPLRPKVVPFDADSWRAGPGSFVPAPSSIEDTGFRRTPVVAKTDAGTFVSFRVVGTFDPARLPRPSALNEVPLETYRPSTLEGATASTRRLLGNRPLRSDLNPGGYLQSPPAILVPLKAMPLFWKSFDKLDRAAPVSSVRVRVAGINGLDPLSRERIRHVAERIRAQTGLDVDITIGASLQNRRVDLPATAAGTPALSLNEQWTKKGVALTITQALDLKSLALFTIILLSAAMTLALIASATVVARRQEFAILACLGWSARRTGAMLGAELVLVGMAAGVLGAVVAWPLARVLDITATWWQVALAVPLGALLAVLPGLAAANAAGRTAPMAAFAPRDLVQRRSRFRLTHAPSFGLLMMSRRPGRAVLSSASVALAVASTTFLLAIVRSFHGVVVGSLLGDAVALQVRGPDLAAAVVLCCLGVTAVLTMMALSVAEDGPVFAALTAVGWRDRALTSAVITQGALVGVAGSLVGGAVAVASTALVAGRLSWELAATAGAVATVATLVCACAGLPSALALRRLPLARILAGD
jgi:hypothetical protein